MKKKILSICLVAVIAILAITGASLAYFTDNETKENVFTFGNVDIELTEANWPNEGLKNVVPGVKYPKNPVINNQGANAAWIRVDVTLSDAEDFDTAAAKYNITDLASIFEPADNFDSNWILAKAPETNSEKDTLTYSYYYQKKLTPNSTTGELFKSVTIPKQFNNADMETIGEDFTITVTAHAIQDEPFETVQEAFVEYNPEAASN